ncbi:MAG: immunoglobulin-like domain-containing protein [Eubacterium ventriosum]|uniref:immunoglobulin-like domain-containing protein n=1 Tax=Eubacterium ventriosum TaxID=39496 RepID=UPI002593B7FD|nr:immunoglobulin-like domain-containing protein [Eubacterium ventriosum]
MKKRILSFVIVAMLIITSSFAGSNILSASENGNSVRLSNKKITIVVGKKRTVKLLNAKSKVKWKIVKGKKLISIKKSGKYNNKLVIKAKKSGKAQVCAYYKSKTFKTYLTIKNKKLSDKNNSKPDAVQETTTVAKNEKVTTNQPATEQPTTIAYKDKADIAISKVKSGVSVTISNFTKDQINFDYSFGNLEKYSDGKWVKALPDNAQYINQEPLITLSYGQSHTFSISFGSQDYESWVLFDGTLETGKYRYTHKVTPVNGKAYEVYAEFDY